MDTDGSFTCTCVTGYTGDGISCSSKLGIKLCPIIQFATHIDIDECAAGTHNCAEGATCVDTDGSFTCTCNAGYTGDGVNCNSKLGTGIKLFAVIQSVLKFNFVT